MPRPTEQAFLPTDATWVGVLLLIVAGVFLAAIVVGLVSRAVAPEKYDDTGPQNEQDADG